MVLLTCDHIVNFFTEKKETSLDWLTIFTTVSPIIIGLVALLLSYFQMVKTLNAKKEDEERAEIRKKLDEFYGPILQLRMKSNLLYQKFNEEYRAVDSNFSTLIYLLNSHVFSGNNKILLEEIIKIGELTEKLIHEKAGLIDDTNLRTIVLPRATTHFLLIRLAYAGALTGDLDRFKTLTFPKDLDLLLEKKKKELEERLKKLNS
ncbi:MULTISPECIES: hypothetical protein [Flavobacterium]|uniref:Uncharacterized protein n=1 Tax=Flavobacterium cutihirudinis TaxID=1265740 RepID=A0A3D9G1B9_9FLAO|nr:MULTISPECIES: hypothetical protein [Flavobacterium]MBZ4040947.1 hypothetical protein [Flavobacterium hibisci]RED27011.1 hypothetical protein BD847_0942 [Flavobacterium cutihirudinis]